MSTYVYRQYQDRVTSNGVEGGDKSNSSSASTTYPSDPVILGPLEIKVYNGQVEKAGRLLRVLAQREGIFNEARQHSRYEKPSEKRRRKKSESRQVQFELKQAAIRPPKERKQKRRAVKREEDQGLV
jgi:small subunit ribosomal protein S21